MNMKIKNSLGLAALVPCGVVIIMLTIFWCWYACRITRQEAMARYSNGVEFLSMAAGEALKSGDDLMMTGALHEFRKNPSLEYADVIGADNIIRVSLDSRRAGWHVGAEIEPLSAIMGDDTAVVHYRPVKGIAGHPRARHEFMKVCVNPLTREKAGMIRVGYSDTEIREKNKTIAVRAALAAAASLALAVFLLRVMVAVVKKWKELA